MKKLMMLVLLAASLLIAVPAAAQTEAKTPDELCAAAPAAEPANRSFSGAEQVLQSNMDYHAIFCTASGAVYIDLFENLTPITVNNFVFLAQNGFYNNTTFHRVIEQFMAQGGDPTATGTGGPNYQFQDEFVKTLRFDQPGRLAMANSGPNTNGSQFFITTVPTPHLNDLHTIFGQVVQGQANVEKIQLRDPATATQPGTTLNTVLIITDPSQVKLNEPALATQDEVVNAFAGVDGLITSDVANLLENQKAVLNDEQLVSGAPDGIRDTLKTFLEQHRHQYRISSLINNKACDLTNIQFISMGYTLDAFASAADAAAALADPALAQFPLQNGFTNSQASENLAYPLFTAPATLCNQSAIHAMTYWQRGAFIAMAEITVVSGANDANIDRILTEFVAQRVYEPILASVLYRDIR